MRQCLEDRDGSIKSILCDVLAKQSANAAVLPENNRMSIRVSRLGQELLLAAQQHLQQVIEAAKGSDEASDATAKLNALQKLQWRFVVIDDGAVNAFVTNLLPGFVFVHRGLVEMMQDNNQLSFIIGHELSHYLCAHGTAEQNVAGFFSVLQILVLAACDPTGLLSVGLELPLFSTLLHYMVAMPMSRRHEREADGLGLMLVARACRDPRSAIVAHETLASIEARAGGDPSTASFGDTHPSTLSRHADLQEQLPDAMKIYDANGCDKIRQTLKWLYQQ
eukprot:CAMPEP_0119322298 /NCGR_PEP_ID=MMETSP1333-20130426/57768_1 /TAXON_ID=418940 /ORGANISM="Scyphosphaera apsteinii, Strain RCC1455" /LENGTH=277 /DNA_ID=CAMNT_0007329489 /DNA_START=211 /DNA_END=1044 /DNA_ORIENTATION=+